MNGLSLEATEPRPGDTIEEQALSVMFDAHAALSEAIRQHDEMERMAQEQKQISEVRERSKKETKMGRDVSNSLIVLISGSIEIRPT